MADEKTNVMRLLDAKKIDYIPHYYQHTDAVNGADIVSVLQQDPHRCCKTLVTISGSGSHYVFVVPVAGELNLKKAAAAVHEKSIAMIPQKELLPLTGYVHGGCSPIGMKKYFPTVFDASLKSFDTIYFSAGKIGYQVEVHVSDLDKILRFRFSDVVIFN